MSLNDDLRKLEGLVSKEGPVFQNHVIDLVRDVMAKEVTLRQNPELRAAIDDFKTVELPHLPVEHSAGAWMKSLLSELPADAEILDIVIGEILHRRRWDEVMAKYPDTLNILKSRIRESDD